MRTTLTDVDIPELRRTPTGWLALGNDYPRIGVTAESEEEVVRLFRERRAAWRLLAQEVPTTSEDNGADALPDRDPHPGRGTT